MKSTDTYRTLFPITEKCIFLNNAAVSSPSLRVVEAVRAITDEFAFEGIRNYSHWMGQVDETRRLFAQLVNAAPNEIAFVQNTSEGLSLIAGGINWKTGDAVLVPSPDFPANIYPWMNLERRGVRVQFYKRGDGGRFGVDELNRAILPGTRLLAVSSVDFSTGFHCDLEAIGDFCRSRGILFCVDAIQSIGVTPMDVKRFGIHFLASGGHKWLLSTMGQGALFVSSEARSEVHPTCVGWKSVVDEDNFFDIRFNLKDNALKFEPGTMNVTGIVALGAAIRLLMEVGIENVRKKVFSLNDAFFEGLMERKLKVPTPMAPGERSGIISFIPHSDPASTNSHLAANGVMVSLRGDKIRMSPHFYNNTADVEAFFRILDAYDGKRP